MDISKLKEKLRELISLDTEGEYSYINEAISEEKIEQFENDHNIKLPEDYRTFINEMFDGGMGPYQIMPLEWWDSVHNATYLDSLGNTLSEPFLLSDTWVEDFEVETPDDDVPYHAIINGTIRICHIGCGSFIFLVVNGPEYGNLWIDDRASNGEIVPLRNTEKTRITFGEWYFNWLDKKIAHFKKEALQKPNTEDRFKIPPHEKDEPLPYENVNSEERGRTKKHKISIDSKKLKIILAIILMALIWFSQDAFWYINFKALYEGRIEAVILDVHESGRDGRQIKISPTGNYFSIYCNNDDILMTGDSISKQSRSDEFKIYRKSGSTGKWEHLNSIHLREDLDYYSFIVKKKE